MDNWTAARCTWITWICRGYLLFFVLITGTSVGDGATPVDNNGTCYFFVDDTLSWIDAERYCQENYESNLTSVPDKHTQQFIESTIEEIWGRSNSHTWIGMHSVKFQDWTWINGYEGVYDPSVWDGGTPPDVTGGVQYFAYLWMAGPPQGPFSYPWRNEVNDYERMGHICQESNSSAGDCNSINGTTGQFAFQGRCYTVYFESQLTWANAEKDCKIRHTSLIEILTEDLQNQLTNTLNQDAWLEVITTVYPNGFWIGLRKAEYIWSDGSEITYTNWGTNEPSDDCVIVDPEEFLWTGTSCSNEELFICSSSSSCPIATTAPISATSIGGGETTSSVSDTTPVSDDIPKLTSLQSDNSTSVSLSDIFSSEFIDSTAGVTRLSITSDSSFTPVDKTQRLDDNTTTHMHNDNYTLSSMLSTNTAFASINTSVSTEAALASEATTLETLGGDPTETQNTGSTTTETGLSFITSEDMMVTTRAISHTAEDVTRDALTGVTTEQENFTITTTTEKEFTGSTVTKTTETEITVTAEEYTGSRDITNLLNGSSVAVTNFMITDSTPDAFTEIDNTSAHSLKSTQTNPLASSESTQNDSISSSKYTYSFQSTTHVDPTFTPDTSVASVADQTTPDSEATFNYTEYVSVPVSPSVTVEASNNTPEPISASSIDEWISYSTTQPQVNSDVTDRSVSSSATSLVTQGEKVSVVTLDENTLNSSITTHDGENSLSIGQSYSSSLQSTHFGYSNTHTTTTDSILSSESDTASVAFSPQMLTVNKTTTVNYSGPQITGSGSGKSTDAQFSQELSTASSLLLTAIATASHAPISGATHQNDSMLSSRATTGDLTATNFGVSVDPTQDPGGEGSRTDTSALPDDATTLADDHTAAEQTNGGLSDGAIAGIAVASFLVLIMIILLIWFLCTHCRNTTKDTSYTNNDEEPVLTARNFILTKPLHGMGKTLNGIGVLPTDSSDPGTTNPLYEGSVGEPDFDNAQPNSGNDSGIGVTTVEPVYAKPIKKVPISNGMPFDTGSGSHPVDPGDIEMNNISVFYADPFDSKGANFPPGREVTDQDLYDSVFGGSLPDPDIIQPTATDDSKFITTIVLK